MYGAFFDDQNGESTVPKVSQFTSALCITVDELQNGCKNKWGELLLISFN
jgi:hypothetical protein